MCRRTAKYNRCQSPFDDPEENDEESLFSDLIFPAFRPSTSCDKLSSSPLPGAMHSNCPEAEPGHCGGAGLGRSRQGQYEGCTRRIFAASRYWPVVHPPDVQLHGEPWNASGRLEALLQRAIECQRTLLLRRAESFAKLIGFWPHKGSH